jgi:stage III sporulation protein SpoIIIAA
MESQRVAVIGLPEAVQTTGLRELTRVESTE